MKTFKENLELIPKKIMLWYRHQPILFEEVWYDFIEVYPIYEPKTDDFIKATGCDKFLYQNVSK